MQEPIKLLLAYCWWAAIPTGIFVIIELIELVIYINRKEQGNESMYNNRQRRRENGSN